MSTRLEWGQGMARRAFEKLDAIVKSRPHGTITQIEDRLGHKEGWWKNHRKPERIMSLPNLLAVLRELGERPGKFFGELLTEEDGEEHENGEEHKNGDLHPLAEKAMCRLSEVDQTQTKFRSTSAALLGQLDDRRYDDPVGVLMDHCSNLRCLSSRSEIARLLAISGSALRMLEEVDLALQLLNAAQRVAQENELCIADVLQRKIYCYNRFRPRSAFACGKEACLIYASRKKFGKIGEVLIDRANTFSATGEFELANRAALSGLSYLEFLPKRYIAGAYQALAMNHHRIGDKEGAIRFLADAEAVAQEMDNRNLRGHVAWARGSITGSLRSLMQAAELFGDLFHYDSTLCTLEVCEKLFAENKIEVLVNILLDRIAWASKSRILYAVRVFENALSVVRLGRCKKFPLLYHRVVDTQNQGLISLCRDRLRKLLFLEKPTLCVRARKG